MNFKVAFFALTFCSTALSQEVSIAINNWTSQKVISHILKNIYSKKSIKSKLVDVSVDDQWWMISKGQLDIQVEVWQGTMEKQFNGVIKSGGGVDVGTYSVATREEWWYPKYVEKLCPGLPDWKALKKCSSIFSTKESSKGIYIGGPWEKPDKARVRALGLDFKITRVEAGNDLWVHLKKAYENKTPIVLFNWSPNWVESKYEGSFVEFPKYDPRCETDASWGINKDRKFDCGNPTGAWMKKLAWKGLKDKSSCAYKILENMNFTNAQISSIAAMVDFDKLTYSEAAQKWLEGNKGLWEKWSNISECN
jgi:glycine betaine/proline transport system substrate-binding protein